MQINNSGLHLLPKDSRDFPLGAVFSLPELKELPKSFMLSPVFGSDQKMTDFCAAASTAGASETQEEVELSFEWTFAVIKMMLGGDVDSYGSDLRTAMKAGTTYGYIERKEAPYSLENKDAAFLRRIGHWPKDLFDKAKKHKKESFFSVVGPYDHYDNIRAAIWRFREEKCVPVLGVLWSWNAADVVMKTVSMNGGGHALRGIGWDERGICIKNSYGPQAGEDGHHFFSREVINKFVDMYGCYMFHDMPKETAQYYMEIGAKADDNWIIQLVKALISFVKPRSKVPDTIPPVTPITPPQPLKSPRERLYDAAVSCLGVDASPQDVAPDEYGCAETVSQIYFKAFGEYIEPYKLSTAKLFAAMVDQPHKFVRVLDPEPGNIIISPTGYSHLADTPIKNGHVGIFGKNGVIMSNSSMPETLGKFLENFDILSWERRYRIKGGYPIYYFKLV